MREFSNRDFFVDPDIRRAQSLPDSAFTDPDFLQLEMETIFNKTWMLVPHHSSPSRSEVSTELLNKPGSRVPFSLIGNPLFLQRNSKKEINCFPNVCTHAWHPLVESASVGGSMVCPQHGREFDSDGRFLSHKGFEKLENFPRESDNLRKLPIENWGPMISVCLGEPFASFRKIAEDVNESIPGVDLASLKYNPLPMRSERSMVIGSSMLGATWTTITFASSTRDLEDWLTLSTWKRIRQNSINVVPYSGPTPGYPRMVLIRNRLRPGSKIRTIPTSGSSLSGGSSFPIL